MAIKDSEINRQAAVKTVGKMWQKLVSMAAFVTLLFLGNSCNLDQPETFEALLEGLYRNSVPLISPAQLTEQLSWQPQTILLDTRTKAEFEVSHLPGATFLNANTFTAETAEKWPRNQPIIVYCSVGYRSERAGEKLQALGFTNVRNLYGGIFQWVNEGRPVVNSQGETDQIHPYSEKWGLWLQKGRQVYAPR